LRKALRELTHAQEDMNDLAKLSHYVDLLRVALAKVDEYATETFFSKRLLRNDKLQVAYQLYQQ
jgi:hypothetical protein